jgi:methylmalonyl-CoA mutase cobalamin-binding domain/chain
MTMKDSVDRNVFDPRAVDALRDQERDWEANEVAQFLNKQAERKETFLTLGDFPVKRTYTAADIADTPIDDIGLPGRYPFTRGPYPTMYRSRNWTMRQIAGFGTGEDTNKRFKFLIAQGQTGISTDFDMPTLMGYDSDHPMSEGEVGREGVAIDTLADMEALFEDIDLEKISVSMTINPSAWILLAMYIVLAQQRGYDLHKLSGTIQADILKEYMAQKEYVFPIDPSVRILRDCITYCAKHMKRYNPINISGYHISEAGSSPLQEAAFTLANLIVYVEEVLKTGLTVDEFAPRLAFFFVCQADFFEEVAKFRALRRCYAKIMRERFGAKNPESMRLRFHCQTAAASLTKPQYMVNVMRTTLQALAAVLGGCQSLHTNCDALGPAYATGHRRRKQRYPNDRSARRFVLRRVADDRVREAHFRDPRRRRRPRGYAQIDQGGLVPAADRRFRVRDGATQAVRRKADDRRQHHGRRYARSQDRDAPV